jgi:hypothetical protein
MKSTVLLGIVKNTCRFCPEVLWIRIRIDFSRMDQDPGGKNSQRLEKGEPISSLEMLDVLFRRLKAFLVAWNSLIQGINKLQF